MTLAKPPRQIVVEEVRKDGAWAYFDGGAKGDPRVYGEGESALYNESHSINFTIRLGHATNNYVELMPLKLLLLLVAKKGISILQVFNDPLIVIRWMKKEQNCLNYLFHPLLEEVRGACVGFINFLSFLYRERNIVVDTLSKDGVQMINGQWYIQAERERQVSNYYHPPFHDPL